jgi:hypothetical protein
MNSDKEANGCEIGNALTDALVTENEPEYFDVNLFRTLTDASILPVVSNVVDTA